MGPAKRTGRGRASSVATAMGASFAVATIALLALVGPTAAAWSDPPDTTVSWSNGVVLCQFAAESPSVAVSHSSVHGTGVTVALTSLIEAASDQSVVASANLSGLVWSVANWSTDDAYDLAYSVRAPLVGASGSPAPVGTVNLTVQFILPAYQGSPEGPLNTVNAVFGVSHWTWQRPGDHLELSFATAPSFPASEHLNATSAPGWLLASTSNNSGDVLEQVGANSNASATSTTGSVISVAANASVAIASPSWAQVTVAFGSSAGAFSSLTYSARVGVVLPSSVAGIPIAELAAAGAAGVLVSLLVAAVAHRVRRRPSNLVYVSEHEQR